MFYSQMIRLGNPAADTKIGFGTSQVGMESNTFNAYLQTVTSLIHAQNVVLILMRVGPM